MSQIYVFENNRIRFTDGFSTYGGKTLLTSKKIKKKEKYYVYETATKKPVKYFHLDKMEIIETADDNRNQYIFFIDTNHHLSFIKARFQSMETAYNIVDELETKPLFKFKLLHLFQSFIFFGVIRFQFYDYEALNFSMSRDDPKCFKITFLFPEKIRKKFSHSTSIFSLLVHFCWTKVSFKDIIDFYEQTSKINIPLYLRVTKQQNDIFYKLKEDYEDLYDKYHFIFNTISRRISQTKNELYVRKTINGQFVFVVTNRLKTSIKLIGFLAYISSLFERNKEQYNVYFEKFCEGASESGIEVFKYAVQTDSNAVYILSRETSYFNELKNKYGDRILKKNSFQAFKHIFLANSFISPDLVTHIQRRLYDNNVAIKKKILKTDKKIFLQHGVSLATNIFKRGYFKKKVPISPDYVVVNSRYEKELFEQKTKYKPEELMLTGTPNLDLYYQSKNDDKKDITFLLTWRPWDLTDKIEEGSYLDRYFQFINLIKENNFYQDKTVNVVLHPKSKNILSEQFPDFYQQNKKYFFEGDIKDAVINSKVLISDYSSLTFYGFAGGSNIVFFWGDKEEAENKYGAPNILQEDSAFGTIIYQFDKLQETVEEIYFQEQDPLHLSRFSTLVERNDGKNTQKTYDWIYNYIL